jgi:prefoldin alpha subunit
MVNQKELQEKILTYRVLQSRIEFLLKQRELVTNKIIEIENTLASIEEFVNSKEKVLFSLGSEAHVFGKVDDKEKIIVEIGANVALEKTIDEGKKTLNERKTELEKNLNEIQNGVMGVSAALEQLTPELQSLMENQESQAG